MEQKSESAGELLRDIAYRRLREDILVGYYRPQDHLREKELADRLKISRTPVREALHRLADEHFVVFSPGYGAIVADISFRELQDLQRVRIFLECMMVRKAAARALPEDISRLTLLLDRAQSAADDAGLLKLLAQYNKAVLELADSPDLFEVLDLVRDKLCRIVVSGHLNPVRRRQAEAEHRCIVAALAANDADEAERTTRIHLEHSNFCTR